MGTEKKLGRQFVYAIATKETKCDSCAATIPIGQPYLTKQSVKLTAEGELIAVTTIECVIPCSNHHAALARLEAELTVEETHEERKPIKYDKCWDSLPKSPDANEMALRVTVARSGNLVARGYTRLVEWEGPRGLNRFLECSPEQVNQKMLAPDPQNSDLYGTGNYASWKTPCGVTVRQSLADTPPNFRSGYWYLPIAVLLWSPVVTLPELTATVNAKRV